MKLNKGINLGGFLSQCKHSYSHYLSFIKEEDIKKIANMGFDHVRLPIDYEVFEDESCNSINEGFSLVNTIIEYCTKYNLNIILDLHKARGYDFNNFGDKDKNNLFSNKELQEAFINLWSKIAKSYTKYDNVALELLNEVVENNNAQLWNDLIKRTVAAIRKESKNTYIIYGGIQWNSANTIKFLEKPIDDKIIFTFHFYEPIIFTHQNAHWMPSIKNIEEVNYPESMDYYKKRASVMNQQCEALMNSDIKGQMGISFLESVINNAIEAANKMNVTLYCGEFGVIDQAPIKDTLNWLKDTVSLFNKHNIGYALWTYKEMDFGITHAHYEPIYNEAIKILTK